MSEFKRELPAGYLIDRALNNGSLVWDDHFVTMLVMLEKKTTGILWWKRTTVAYVPVREFRTSSTDDDIANFAFLHAESRAAVVFA